MSDIFNTIFTKNKKFRYILPLSYLREIIYGVQIILSRNVLDGFKLNPLNIFSRLFGRSRQSMVNVLVLVSDLESNVGAACLELINENSEWIKYRGLRYPDLNLDSFSAFDSHFDYEFNDPDFQEESRILDANISSYDNLDEDINPNYLMQVSISTTNKYDTEMNNDKEEEVDDDQLFEKEEFDSSIEFSNSEDQTTLSSHKSSNFEHDKENDSHYENEESNSTNEHFDYADDDDDDDDDYEEDFILDESHLETTNLPKTIRREIHQIKLLGIPFDYFEITESSHEYFKSIKSDCRLSKKQISAMIGIRRRYINRRAATRCRNQKLQVKDSLKEELKRLENQLLHTKISLNKAYQTRNEMRDQFRRVQQDFLTRLRDSNSNVLLQKKWTIELHKDRRGIIAVERSCQNNLGNMGSVSELLSVKDEPTTKRSCTNVSNSKQSCTTATIYVSAAAARSF